MKNPILLFCLLFITNQDYAQQKNLDMTLKRIDTVTLNHINTAGIPGFAVGVIINNHVVLKKTYGVQSAALKTPMTAHSDFHMASVSKPFTATAVMQLVRSGKLNLDSTLVHYLPYFKMKDERYKQITLYHILTHASGIPDVTDYEWSRPQTDDGAAERYVKSFGGSNLDFAPGTKFNYSNAAFDILADVIAKASGVSFETYIRNHIFMPAGMNESSFILNDIHESRRTSPHIIDETLTVSVNAVYPYNRIHAPSSTLHSDLNDMLKWASLWINKGKINKTQIIDTASWKNMLQPRKQAFEEYQVCLSWFEATIGTKKVFFHSGGDPGYRSFVGFVPDEGIAVVLMGNNELFDGGEMGLAVFKSILLNEPIVYSPPPIFWKLKRYIVNDGIAKVKAVYFEEQKNNPHQYAFGASNLITLADWLYDRGYKEKSVEVLVFCNELDPKNPAWCKYIAGVYDAWNKKDQAILWYRKTLALDPSDKEVGDAIKKLGGN